MAPDLEQCEWERGAQDITAWMSHSMPERRYGLSEKGKQICKVCEKDTPERHESELNERQGDGIRKHVEDGFGGGIGEGRAHVPYDAQDLNSTVSHCAQITRPRWDSYDEFHRHGRLPSLGYLLGICAHTAFPCPDGSDCVTETFLPIMPGAVSREMMGTIFPSQMTSSPLLPSAALQDAVRFG